ncbi:MAG TPA: pyridoxamine 5'-phosphate oxidase family protein [Rhodocyclaceae bacterium]|nr:pyridoxamine 5'-phosphate oxidase family protein [Rhodocyclaceae bacterium]
MAKIEGNCRDVLEATEFVTIVTAGDDGPHVVGNWGDYMRVLGIGADTLVFLAGHYRQTEQNLLKNNRIQVLVASKKVQGTRGLGQSYLIAGTAEIVTSGDVSDAAKAKLPWARGALLIHVEDVTAQL